MLINSVRVCEDYKLNYHIFGKLYTIHCFLYLDSTHITSEAPNLNIVPLSSCYIIVIYILSELISSAVEAGEFCVLHHEVSSLLISDV